MLRTTLGALALITLSSAALAEDQFTLGEITVHDPRIFETAPTAKAAGGYMLIENSGGQDDRLLRVEADFPRVMLHTTVESEGVARMEHVEAVEIPAGASAVLEPGGLHVMFMGGSETPLAAGGEFPATLIFENAGTLDVTFRIDPR